MKENPCSTQGRPGAPSSLSRLTSPGCLPQSRCHLMKVSQVGEADQEGPGGGTLPGSPGKKGQVTGGRARARDPTRTADKVAKRCGGLEK